jgi:hypothetical protein
MNRLILSKQGSSHAVFYFVLLAVALLAPPHVRGQLLQGTIEGNVMDTSQAVVVGASVRATNQQTTFSREAVTNPAGGYTLPTLPPGTYTLTVSAPGFQTQNQTGIAVTSNDVTRRDVTLALGTVSETVEVGAQASALQTDRSDVRSELGTNTLNNVPVPIGRNYQMLFVTLPGISPPTNSNSFTANPNRALQFSSNGGGFTTNNTRIDGTSAFNVAASNVALYIPALDAIEAVNVVTNAFDAEQGMAGGAAVNLTIKSGTNAIHGSLFENHADQHLKAYAWNADRTQSKSKYIHNQFGGTIGGPIKKDKLFYFASYEGTRYRESSPTSMQVPTPAMKSGNLSASPTTIYDPTTGNPDGSGRMPFRGNIIPPQMIDQGVKALIATGAWLDPNQKGTGAFGLGRNLLSTASGGQSRDQFDNKLSWNPTNKLFTFVRFGFNNNSYDTPEPFGLLGGPSLSRTNTAVGTGYGHIFSGTISATYVLTPNLVMDAYFGYSRNDNSSRQPNLDKNIGTTLLSIPGLDTSGLTGFKKTREGGMPDVNIDGFAILGPPNQFQPQDYRDPEHEYVGNLNWVKGTHNLRTGFDLDYSALNEDQVQAPVSGLGNATGAGGFHFSQGTTQLRGGPAGNDFNAFASFLLGLPVDAGKIHLFPDEVYGRNKSLGLYVRDRWQIMPRLTLTYGARWEWFPMPDRVTRGLEKYDFKNNQMLVCGVGSTPWDCGITKDKQRVVPRIGIAYRITDSTVFRAGYGIANDPVNLLAVGPFQGRFNSPDYIGQVLNAPNSFGYATTWRLGLPLVTAPNISSGVVPIPGTTGVRTYDNDFFVRGYFQSWNVTLEQRIRSWTVSAGYVATRAVHSIQSIERNWGAIGGGTAGQVLFPAFGRTASTQMEGTLGTNKYDSLQMRVQHPLSSSFQVSAGYTFGKALGYGGNTPIVAIPSYYHKNYGLLPTDIQHNLQATMVFAAPFGKGKRWAQSGLGAIILGGWQLSGLTSFYSGLPFTATASTTTLNAPFSSQFADCLTAPTQIGSILQWYDKSAFAPPATGRFGTCGINNLRGPGLVNADAGLDRSIAISEKFIIKFRVEMFNVANTPHHAIPNATNSSINSSTFMQALDIANTGREGIDERAVRLSLRVAW